MVNKQKIDFKAIFNNSILFFKKNSAAFIRYGMINFAIMSLAQIPLMIYLWSNGYGEHKEDLLKFFEGLLPQQLLVIYVMSLLVQLIGLCLISGLFKVVLALLEGKPHSFATLTDCSNCFGRLAGCYFVLMIFGFVPMFIAGVSRIGAMGGGFGAIVALFTSGYLVLRAFFAVFFVTETKMTVREAIFSSLAMTGSQHATVLKLMLAIFSAALIVIITYGFAAIAITPFLACLLAFSYLKMKGSSE